MSQQGAVFVYNLDGTNKIKIQPSDGGTDDQFGSAVAVGEGKIFVSSPYWDAGGLQNTGQVYAYNLDGTNEEKLIMPSAVAYDNIGYQKSLAVGSDRIIVGAQYADPNGQGSAGAAYFWKYTQELTSVDFSNTYRTILAELVQDIVTVVTVISGMRLLLS